MLSSLFELLQKNWVATILGIIALGLAIYQIFERKGPRLSYQFTGLRLIGKTIDPLPAEVSILFEGQELDHLSRTEVILWNRGPAAVRRTDLTNNDPLRISFSAGTKILMFDVIRQTRDSIAARCTLTEDRRSLLVDFEFLDRDDGITITLWHDDSDTTPSVEGTIIGQKKGIVSYGRFIPPVISDGPRPTPASRTEKVFGFTFRFMKYRRVPVYVLLAMGAFFIVDVIFHDRLVKASPLFFGPPSASMRPVVTTVFGLLYLLMAFWFLLLSKRRFPKALAPPDQKNES